MILPPPSPGSEPAVAAAAISRTVPATPSEGGQPPLPLPGPPEVATTAPPQDDAGVANPEAAGTIPDPPAKEDPLAAQFRALPIRAIVVPAGHRSILRTRLAGLMRSIAAEGLHLPILVRVAPAGPKPFELIAGRQRLEACRKLGWTEIPARVLDLDDEMAEMAQIATNYFCHPLTKKQAELALARWEALYQWRHPETKQYTAGGVARARKSPGPDGSEAAPTSGDPAPSGDAEGSAETQAEPFSQVAADHLRVSRRTAERILKRGRIFSEDDYETFAQCGVNLTQQNAIAAIADADRRAACIEAIVQGLDPAEAIECDRTPPASDSTESGPLGAAEEGESSLPDAAWLESVGGELRRRLASTVSFDANALLYRRIDKARRAFQAGVQPALDELPEESRRSGLASLLWRLQRRPSQRLASLRSLRRRWPGSRPGKMPEVHQ